MTPSARGQLENLPARVASGDQAAVGRALSVVIDEAEGFEALAKAFFVHAGKAHKIGVCGPPGCGKSTLINRLVSHYRKADEKVGVLAVDPTSPWTGGAFLGDRLRVQEHALDPGVFFRSLGSRGAVGGLSNTIFNAIHVLEAYGCRRIFIETVGTGQDEVEIAHAADSVLVLTAPSLGDEIQAMKAGSMEVADILVVNKADLPETDKALASLREALGLSSRPEAGWKTRICATSAATAKGVTELSGILEEHRAYLAASSEGRRRAKDQLRKELSWFISRRLVHDTVRGISDEHLELLLLKRTDPVTLGEKFIGGTDPAIRKPGSPAIGGTGRRMDHVGVAVESIDAVLPFYREVLGWLPSHREEVRGQKVRVVFLKDPASPETDSQVELLEPMGKDGPVAVFLDKRGPGLHHAAFRSSNIVADMKRLARAGRPALEDAPRPGAGGRRVCFLHPRYARGVLIELVGA